MPLHTIPLCSFSYVGEFYSGATFKYDTTENIVKSSSKMLYEKYRGRLRKYDNNTLNLLTKEVVKNKEFQINSSNIEFYKNIGKQVEQLYRSINKNYEKSLLSLVENQLQFSKVTHLVKTTIKNIFISKNKALNRYNIRALNIGYGNNLEIKRKASINFNFYKQLKIKRKANGIIINKDLIWLHRLNESRINKNDSIFRVKRYKHRGLGIYNINKELDSIIDRDIDLKNNNITIERCNVKLIIKSKDKYIQRKVHIIPTINVLQNQLMYKVTNNNIYTIIKNKYIRRINNKNIAKMNLNKLMNKVITTNIETYNNKYTNNFKKISTKYISKNKSVYRLKKCCVPRKLLNYSTNENSIWMYRLNKNRIYKTLNSYMDKIVRRSIYVQNNIVILNKYRIKSAFKANEKYTEKWSLKNIANISCNKMMYKDGQKNIYTNTNSRYIEKVNNKVITNTNKNKLVYDTTIRIINKERYIGLYKASIYKISKDYFIELSEYKEKAIFIHNIKKLKAGISENMYITKKIYKLNKTSKFIYNSISLYGLYKVVNIFKTKQYELGKSNGSILKEQWYSIKSNNSNNCIYKDKIYELIKFNTLISNDIQCYFTNKIINSISKDKVYKLTKPNGLISMYVENYWISKIINTSIVKNSLYDLSKGNKIIFKYMQGYSLDKTINIYKNNQYNLIKCSNVIFKRIIDYTLNQFTNINIYKNNKYTLSGSSETIFKHIKDSHLNRVNNIDTFKSKLHEVSKFTNTIFKGIYVQELNAITHTSIYKDNQYGLNKHRKIMFKFIPDYYLNTVTNIGIFNEKLSGLIKVNKNILQYIQGYTLSRYTNISIYKNNQYGLSKYIKTILTYVQDQCLNRVSYINIFRGRLLRLAKLKKLLCIFGKYYFMDKLANNIFKNIQYKLTRLNKIIWIQTQYCSLNKSINNIFKDNLYKLNKFNKEMYIRKKYNCLNRFIDSIFKYNSYELNKLNVQIVKCKQYNLRKATMIILKNIYDISILEVIKRWWILESNGPYDKKIIPFDYNYGKSPLQVNRQDREYGCLTALDKHPISFMPYLEDLKGTDLNYELEEMNLSIEIMIEMVNIVGMVIKHSESQFTRCSGKEAIEFTMESVLNWLNLESTIKEMNIKNSREHYLRCYKWIRWEAEKVWFMADKNDNLEAFRGVKYANVLLDNLMEYMEYHHFNKVPLWRNLKAMDVERQFNRVVTNNDLMKKLDKLKGKRHYEIKTENYKKNNIFRR